VDQRNVARATAAENDPSLVARQWQDSVVAVWTPGSRVSGFAVDSTGEEKPERADETRVDPKVVARISEDFAPYRALAK